MFKTELRWVVVLIFVLVAPCTTSQLATAQSAAPLYPDIVEQISHLQIQNEHQTEMLRFSTTHINLGYGPLQIRGGGQVAPCVIDGIAYDHNPPGRSRKSLERKQRIKQLCVG
jgi:hypothetical protein